MLRLLPHFNSSSSLSSSPSSSSPLLQHQLTLLSESLSLMHSYTHNQSDSFKTSLLLLQLNCHFSKKPSLKDTALMNHSQKGMNEKSCILTMLCDFTLKPRMETNDDVFNRVASFAGDACDSTSVRGFLIKVFLLFLFLNPVSFIYYFISEFIICKVHRNYSKTSDQF